MAIMFTGIIKTIGKVKAFHRKASSGILFVEARLEDVEKGDSIAVNGICLTVEAYTDSVLRFFVGRDTIRDTTVNSLKSGSLVNLEPALRMGDKLGGHILSGHIRAIGKIISIRRDGKIRDFKIQAPPSFTSHLNYKDSVGVDGVSLTVQRLGKGFFEVMLIPETLSQTVLGQRRVGDKVNLE